jgi:hypothetical protein
MFRTASINAYLIVWDARMDCEDDDDELIEIYEYPTFSSFEALPPWVQEAIAVLDLCRSAKPATASAELYVSGIGKHLLTSRGYVMYYLETSEEIICYE